MGQAGPCARDRGGSVGVAQGAIACKGAIVGISLFDFRDLSLVFGRCFVPLPKVNKIKVYEKANHCHDGSHSLA